MLASQQIPNLSTHPKTTQKNFVPWPLTLGAHPFQWDPWPPRKYQIQDLISDPIGKPEQIPLLILSHPWPHESKNLFLSQMLHNTPSSDSLILAF